MGKLKIEFNCHSIFFFSEHWWSGQKSHAKKKQTKSIRNFLYKPFHLSSRSLRFKEYQVKFAIFITAVWLEFISKGPMLQFFFLGKHSFTRIPSFQLA